MIKVENVSVSGFSAAARGMRNPLASHAKSDSEFKGSEFIVGPNDLDLMHRLYVSGPEHAKYLRQIHVSMDVTAPLYWWKEADQYKVATSTNSYSTMHKIASKEFTLDDFSHEHLTPHAQTYLEATIGELNYYRNVYIHGDDHRLKNEKEVWWQMIQLLPSSYNQKRTWDFDYQTAISMINQRSNHKLDEWRTFTAMLLQLPNIKEIINGTGENK